MVLDYHPNCMKRFCHKITLIPYPDNSRTLFAWHFICLLSCCKDWKELLQDANFFGLSNLHFIHSRLFAFTFWFRTVVIVEEAKSAHTIGLDRYRPSFLLYLKSSTQPILRQSILNPQRSTPLILFKLVSFSFNGVEINNNEDDSQECVHL